MSDTIDLDLNPDLYDTTNDGTPERTLDVRDRKEQFMEEEFERDTRGWIKKEKEEKVSEENEEKVSEENDVNKVNGEDKEKKKVKVNIVGENEVNKVSGINKVSDKVSDKVSEVKVSEENEVSADPLFPHLIPPFEETYTRLQAEFSENQQDGLSSGQQSRFINYMDQELLKIQRKFVKSQVEEELYPPTQLIADLSNMIDMIWTTVKRRNILFGQVEYFIKMANDLEDYLMHYPPVFSINNSSPLLSSEDRANLASFFGLFQALDVRLSILFDGYETLRGTMAKMNSTHAVRLSTIITRLRIIVTTGIDSRRVKLEGMGGDEAKEIVDVLDVECGRLFEGLFDRLS